ncbi:MAG TPA: pyridoxamine 5'-phosphate oxidase family protein [Pseudobdellovibrionaceae bacterium]|nr:pyridoxamine 5'-phosphate oxidase family protein [Pseudobdellovibrionaceae bacterium]
MGDHPLAFEKLSEMVREIKVAMLTTIDSEGLFRSRPMMAQEIDLDGTLWFFSARESGKVHSIEDQPHINLAYSSPDTSRYVSVSGMAEVVDDPARKKELWSPMYRAWFPRGVEDPDLVLVKVRVEAAEYWDASSSRLVTLIGAAKAALTGRRPPHDEALHAKIELH